MERYGVLGRRSEEPRGLLAAAQEYGSKSLDGIGRGARAASRYVDPFQYITPENIASFLPGAGYVQSGQDMRDSGEHYRQGNYGQAALSGAQGVVNAGLEALPLSAALPAMSVARRPGKLKADLPSEDGYVYHATNTDRAPDIAASGLKTHKAHEFTDQDVWPDGGTERRAYFTPTAANTWQFAPEEGTGALLRIKAGPEIQKERYTNDLYSRKPIPANRIEMMAEDGNYYPIKDFYGQD